MYVSRLNPWLLLRGLRTLPVRLERIAATTATVLAHLAKHPKVRCVHAPVTPYSTQPELSAAQLHHASGLFSIELDVPDLAAIDRFCNALKRFLLAASWGGYESLAFPVAGVRDWGRLDAPASVPLNLVRLSIGLEDPAALIADLDQALAAI